MNCLKLRQLGPANNGMVVVCAHVCVYVVEVGSVVVGGGVRLKEILQLCFE